MTPKDPIPENQLEQEGSKVLKELKQALVQIPEFIASLTQLWVIGELLPDNWIIFQKGSIVFAVFNSVEVGQGFLYTKTRSEKLTIRWVGNTTKEQLNMEKMFTYDCKEWDGEITIGVSSRYIGNDYTMNVRMKDDPRYWYETQNSLSTLGKIKELRKTILK